MERAGSRDIDGQLKAEVARALFRRLLLLFGKREALRLFPASCPFLHIISTVAVSHNPQR